MKPEIKTMFDRRDTSNVHDYYINVNTYLSIYEVVARVKINNMILAYAHLDEEEDVEDIVETLKNLIELKYPNIKEVPNPRMGEK